MTNKKNTRRALFLSVISLMLCCAMLVGTTFAWFTDSVTSGNNIIKSGNLDVEMYYADGTQAVPAKDSTDWKDASKEAIFNCDLWEPGYTEVRHIKISNVGNLALKYQLQLNANGDVTALTDAIDVYYMNPAVQVSSRTALNESNKLGTLTAVLAEMSKTASGTLEADKDVNVTLALKMRETAGNEYQNLSIGSEFSVVLHATQLTSEEDSFGSDYDAYAGLPWDGETVTEALVADEDGVYHITSAADLVAMMNDTKYPNCNKYQKVVLETNINLGGHTVSGFGDDSCFFDGIFDGQGYTISNFTIDASNRTYYAGLFNQVSQYSDENTVIKNLTVKGATVIGPGQVGVIAGGMNGNTVVDNCKVINCTAIGVKKVGAVVGYTAGGTVTNNYAENCTVLYSEKEGAEILGYENTGSTVSGNIFNNVVVAKYSTPRDTAELQEAISSDAKNVKITLTDAGKYQMPSVNDTKEITIKGTKDTVIDNTNGAYMENATVSFEGVTIKGSTGYVNGNGADYAALYTPDVTYTNCTFDGPFKIGRDGATFINCTFTNLGNDYIWTYGNDATFKNCSFETDGKALLIYSDGGNEVSKVVVENCTFNATTGAKASAIANQNCAAIEIHNYGNGVDLTTSGNSYSSNFSGEWRIKTYETGKPQVFVNGTEYTTIAIDGKTMTIADKNVTVNG